MLFSNIKLRNNMNILMTIKLTLLLYKKHLSKRNLDLSFNYKFISKFLLTASNLPLGPKGISDTIFILKIIF